MSPFKLAISAEMVFLDLPFIERVKRIHELGFSAEIWNDSMHARAIARAARASSPLAIG